MAEFGRLLRQSSNDVVGLETLLLQHGNAKGFQRPANVRDLLRQVLRHFCAVRLVTGVFHFIECLGGGIELANL